MPKAIKPSATAIHADQNAEESDALLDVLKTEYQSLHQLYAHTEDALVGIFNFYLTLLSAITGAIIVLVQIATGDLSAVLGGIIALLVLVVLIGVITQDAIVNKNIELTNYGVAINLLKRRLFQSWPAEMKNIFYLRNFWSRVSPLLPPSPDFTGRVHQRFWWLFPLGTHQLFIGMINSLALTVMIVTIVQMLTASAVSAARLGIGSILFVIISFEVHVIYAQTKHRRGVENVVTASGAIVDWK